MNKELELSVRIPMYKNEIEVLTCNVHVKCMLFGKVCGVYENIRPQFRQIVALPQH